MKQIVYVDNGVTRSIIVESDILEIEVQKILLAGYDIIAINEINQ